MNTYFRDSRITNIGWLAGCVVAAAGLSGGCGGSATTRETKAGAASQVKVIQLQATDVRREVEAVGTLAARDETVVSAEVEGRVARLAADMGDRVALGSTLVVLDPEKLRYRVDEQRAALEQTRARLGGRGADLPAADDTPDVRSARAQKVEAEQRLERARQLASKQLLPKQELDRAVTQLETAAAAYEAAIASSRNLRAELTAREAALNGATRELQATTVRAPFDGVVAERFVSQGQFVQVQTPLVRIVRLHPLRLVAEIPERFGPAIRVGQTLSVRVDAYPDAPVEGRVTRISPDVNLKSRAFTIEGEVPNPEGTLKPGTFARLRVVTDRVDRTLSIPVTAVQTRYSRSLVFVVRGGTLVASEVKLGDRLGANVEILSGLEPGASIVADNVEGLSEGMAVTASPATAGASR